MTQEITVHVPIERVTDFYEWFGQWVAGGVPNAARDSTTDLQPWHANDTDQAQKVWDKLSAPARKLFDVLIERPGDKIHREEIARRVGLGKGKYGVAGALAWPGRHSYGIGREMPILFETTGEGTRYWMEPHVAELFRQARAAD